MSWFYGYLQGSGRTLSTRGGHKSTGFRMSGLIGGHGCPGGVEVEFTWDEGMRWTRARVFVTSDGHVGAKVREVMNFVWDESGGLLWQGSPGQYLVWRARQNPPRRKSKNTELEGLKEEIRSLQEGDAGGQG